MDLIWVRGGKWRLNFGAAEVEGFDELERRLNSRKFRFRHLEPENSTRPTVVISRRRAHLRMKRAHASARVKSADWRHVWGVRLGLATYVVGKPEIRAALRFAQAFWEELGGLPADERFSDGPEVTAVEERLCGFLERFGPLSYIYGLVETRYEAARAVDLFEMDEELCRLGEAWLLANRPKRADDQSLRMTIDSGGRESLRDFVVEPVLSKSRMGLTAQPDTLRSLLWLEVRSKAYPKRRCRFCTRPVDQPPGRHRPFEYCERHQDSRFRKSVMRRKLLRAQQAVDVTFQEG